MHLLRRVLGPARLDRLAYANAGHGYDAFGLHPDVVAFGEAMAAPLQWLSNIVPAKWFLRETRYPAYRSDSPCHRVASRPGS